MIKPISALRRRMIDDMMMRNLSRGERWEKVGRESE